MPDPRMNCAPEGFDLARDISEAFREFYAPLHRRFTERQQALAARRLVRLSDAHHGLLPNHLPPSEATTSDWRITLPAWCQDQRNQMTGPADDGELVVKMLNSGAPGVMLDLEDSMANAWPNLMLGIRNIHAALNGTLTYEDRKRGGPVGIEPSATVIWSRVRGLHISQAGLYPGEDLTSASLFDVAMLLWPLQLDALKHPPCVYIPKTESADEGLWWADVFQAIEKAKHWPPGTIKCMALVESHPFAFEMEEFLYSLRRHILGLNLGRWDYMASLIHFTLADPAWVLPDRNTIPHDVPFFQRLRHLMADLCHRRGALAIGGMTALFPSREDPELNTRALVVLEQDKKNEASCFMDGAWTGHPDQNAIAVAQFPSPNQLSARPQGIERYPDLRPVPAGVGKLSLDGTRAAVRTAIRYRNGVLNGRGASLLDGYMEDLATDRIYRLMIAQRMVHRDHVTITGPDGFPIPHTPQHVTALFDEELEKLLDSPTPGRDLGGPETMREARKVSEQLISKGWFSPI